MRLYWVCKIACAVETCEAGEGCVEIEVIGPSGRAIPHTLSSLGPNVANVSFLPTECGLHHATVTFNKEPIPGECALVLADQEDDCFLCLHYRITGHI